MNATCNAHRTLGVLALVLALRNYLEAVGFCHTSACNKHYDVALVAAAVALAVPTAEVVESFGLNHHRALLEKLR